MGHRFATSAERDLDDVWLYVARESNSIEVANHLIETITNRCAGLGNFPYLGRSRDQDLGPGYRTFVVGDYALIYRVDKDDALILRVVHGRRDLKRLFGE